MNDETVVRDWLFKGLAVEDMLDTFEGEGLAVRAANDPGAVQRLMPLEDFSVSIRRSALDALPAYLAFFCIENAVRELVTERMSEAKGRTGGLWERVLISGRRSMDARRRRAAIDGTSAEEHKRSSTRTSAT